VKRPGTQHARSGDLMIAYQITGEGNTVDLMLVPGTMSHLSAAVGAAEVAPGVRVSISARHRHLGSRPHGVS
jgi:hypothetical protein